MFGSSDYIDLSIRVPRSMRLRIDDGSGSIDVRDVAGTVTVSDGSGSITVENAGDFELLDDGSGSVNLEGIDTLDRQ